MIEFLYNIIASLKVCFKKPLLFLMVMFLLQGCLYVNNTQIDKKDTAFSKFIRGTVYIEDQHLKIRACGSSSIAILKDPEQLLRKHFTVAGERLPSLYIEANASAAGAIDWRLESLYFVSQRPQQCGAKLRGLDYLLESLDGRIQAQISGLEVIISKRDIYTQLKFASQREGNVWKGDIQLAQGRRFKMLLTVEEQPCIDERQQWYSASAEVILNGESHLGCVRRGDTAKKFASGNYSNALSQDSAFIVLDLQQDSSADLIIDFRNGHPLEINQGQWKMLSSEVLELTLGDQSEGDGQSVMLFQVFNNKELRLKGFSEILGSNGLQLLPVK
jgi:hypothetical protein